MKSLHFLFSKGVQEVKELFRLLQKNLFKFTFNCQKRGVVGGGIYALFMPVMWRYITECMHH